MVYTPEEQRERDRESARRYEQRNKEKRRARHKTPEAKIRRRKYVRKCYKKHKDEYTARARKSYSPEKRFSRWRQSLEIRAGRPCPDSCEVCGDNTREMHFDHCHKRNVFRGWICTTCNVALGMVQDDPDRLRKLIAYLERTKDLISPQLSLPGV